MKKNIFILLLAVTYMAHALANKCNDATPTTNYIYDDNNSMENDDHIEEDEPQLPEDLAGTLDSELIDFISSCGSLYLFFDENQWLHPDIIHYWYSRSVEEPEIASRLNQYLEASGGHFLLSALFLVYFYDMNHKANFQQ